MMAEMLVSHIDCVLVRTSLAGNIGASARALRTMGLRRLSLVAPFNYPHPDAVAFAAGAGDVLDEARVVESLDSALADAHLVIGASARRRGIALPSWSPREAALRSLDMASSGRKVALVFGNERTGLDNDELMRCHAALVIPSDPDYGSLNLSQAVQVVAYELRLALLARNEPVDVPGAGRDKPTHRQMETFFEHLARMLDDIDFHKGRSPATILRRLRRLVLRADPDPRELRILHGLLRDTRRATGLGARRKDGDRL